MSRAFVKESDNDEALAPIQHVDSGAPNYITPAGLAALESRIEARRNERAQVAADPTRLDAKAALAQFDNDIAYLDGRRERAIVVEPPAPPWTEVGIGARVEAIDEHDQRHVFTIVGEDETDVANGRVSWVSPIGAAVMGQPVGELVDWERPAGVLNIEIVAVSYSR